VLRSMNQESPAFRHGECQAPRIELFAREPHDGWDVWGNEVK